MSGLWVCRLKGALSAGYAGKVWVNGDSLKNHGAGFSMFGNLQGFDLRDMGGFPELGYLVAFWGDNPFLGTTIYIGGLLVADHGGGLGVGVYCSGAWRRKPVGQYVSQELPCTLQKGYIYVRSQIGHSGYTEGRWRS